MADDELLAGRYRTIRLLGTGGMARVYLAEDERLGRPVAVKRLHAHSPEDIARRFDREARLGASLNHPNLVAVYDVETDGESVLIVMEYVEGSTLADELRAGPVEQGRGLDALSDVAAALDAVHGGGIVHRDVKPANVLLRTDGTAKLADLGIALVSEATELTASGSVLGTVSYMAPEQVDGRRVGPGADIYALAAVAFEVLSGHRAHGGETPMTLAHSITTGAPPDIRDVWPEAPAALARALMRGMARRPEDRQPRAGELAAEIETALDGAPAEAPTVVSEPTRATSRIPTHDPPAPPPPQQKSRYGRTLGLPALALAVLAAGAGVALLLTKDDGGSDPPQTRAQTTRTSTVERTVTTPPVTQTTTTGTDTAETTPGQTGAQLNARGFALLKRGDTATALPILQDAVAAFPPTSTDLDYAFALFNYARALRLSGRSAEAVPLLEKRLSFSDNQRPVVEKELRAARKEAARP